MEQCYVRNEKVSFFRQNRIKGSFLVFFNGKYALFKLKVTHCER